MLQKIKEYLNTINRYPDGIFIKFKRVEGSFEISLCVSSIRIFTKFLDDPYYEPLAWFTTPLSAHRHQTGLRKIPE